MQIDATPATRRAYEARDRTLRAKAAKELGRARLSDEAYVDWLIESAAPALSASSWRQYRAAARHMLESAGAPKELVARLKAAVSGRRKPAGTSAHKAKRLPQDDFARIVASARAGRPPNARALGLCLAATRATGLRPAEWASARIEERERGSWALIVVCGKRNKVRAHSERRTLIFDESATALKKTVVHWLAVVSKAESEGGYERSRETLGALMRKITMALFPRRTHRPTLYSARHEAAARFKAFYIERYSDPEERLHGAAIVAALLGHASDLTATEHYGRPTRGERSPHWPTPRAEPAEVARVKARLGAKLEAFAAMRAERAAKADAENAPAP